MHARVFPIRSFRSFYRANIFGTVVDYIPYCLTVYSSISGKNQSLVGLPRLSTGAQKLVVTNSCEYWAPKAREALPGICSLETCLLLVSSIKCAGLPHTGESVSGW